ncbi:MAG TPA: aspartyl/asparaginyl beta-hydroxylase domain-containing protein [Nitrospiraceae bacterium]|nr:aspartyl/asparaginyl beta-hydroxylase domain-containing protein [Nitrospiraceae bacterium]
MKYLRPLVYGLDVSSVVAELDAHPELWNRYTLRTEGYAPAHNGVSDIWIRYRAIDELHALRKEYPHPNEVVVHFVGEPHESVWYSAIDLLPNLRTLIFDLMRHFEAERLGGVLITRIPPGGEVKPHIDHGWHATTYEKIAVQLKSAPGQTFCYDDGAFECAPGTVYSFNNNETHWVSNGSTVERITCIVCVKRDQRLKPLWCGDGERDATPRQMGA